MVLRKGIPATLAALLLYGCGSSELGAGSYNHAAYGQAGNMREYGVVVSVKETDRTVTNGGIWHTIGLWFGTADPNVPTDTETIPTIHYVIDKTNGDFIEVNQAPAENEPILYPGQKVMIQTNGDYIRVYKADVEQQRY